MKSCGSKRATATMSRGDRGALRTARAPTTGGPHVCCTHTPRRSERRHPGFDGASAHRGLQRKHVLKRLLLLAEHAKAQQAAQQRRALEQARRVFLVLGQQHTRSLADARQGQLDAPHLTLVLQAELADELHLSVEALLLERTARRTRGLAMVAKEGGVRHGALRMHLRSVSRRLSAA